MGIPEPGSRRWWENTPPRCRSLADAPAELRERLRVVDVWIQVPREIPEPPTR